MFFVMMGLLKHLWESGKEKFIVWENLQEKSILSLLSEIRKPGRFIHEHAKKKKKSHWVLMLADAVVRGSLWSSSHLFDNEARFFIGAISERDFAVGNCFCVFKANVMTDALCQRTQLGLPHVQWGTHSLRPKEQDSLMADHEGPCFRGRAASVIQGSISLEMHPRCLVDGTIGNKQEWTSIHWSVYSYFLCRHTQWKWAQKHLLD